MNDPKTTDAISRSAVIDRIAEFLGPKGLDEWEVMVAIRDIIENAPALDVAPVVHAKWSRDAWNDMRCSHCKERIPYKHCYCEEDDNEWDEEIAQTPWCMYCGARMDGED